MSTHHAALTPTIRRSIVLLALATFSSMAVQRLCDAMLPELARVFDTSLGQAARVVSSFALVYGLSQLVYGAVGDRLGKFRVITHATLACALGSVLAVFATSLDMLVLARILVALGAAAIIPLSLAWIGDNVAYEQRQETLARVGLGTALGIFGGQLMGGLFTDTLGWRWAFGFMAVVFGSVGLLLHADWRRQGRPRGQHGPETASLRTQVRAVFGSRWSRLVLSIALLEGAAGFGVLAIWAAHLHRALGLSLAASGAIVALFGLGGMAYMALARPMIRWLGERGLSQWGVSLVALAALTVALTPHWLPAALASLLAGFGFFMFHNTMQTHATQMAPAARGLGVSMFAACLFLGQSLGVSLATVLVDRLGSGSVIILGGAVLGALGLGFAHALRRRARA